MRYWSFILAIGWCLFGGLPAQADQNDPRLDVLFAKLQAQDGPHGARMVEQMIWGVWLESDSATVSLLMQRGVEAMNERRFDTALEAFTSIVEQAPEFAEGWNKRATLFYLMGRFRESLADVENEEGALEAYEQALQVNPHLPLARLEVERLRKKVRGNRI